MTYLDPVTAQMRLVAMGSYTAETAPSLLALKLLIHAIEERIDAWLGYHAASVPIKSRVRVNGNGYALLPRYPVQEVTAIEVFVPARPSLTINRSATLNTYWLGDRRIRLPYPNCNVDCFYKAGYDPVPEIFSDTVLQVLTEMLTAIAINEMETGVGSLGDALAFLSERSSNVTSTSLPGGLSQSFELGDAPKMGGSTNPLDRILAGTNLAKYLSLFGRYQRRLLT